MRIQRVNRSLLTFRAFPAMETYLKEAGQAQAEQNKI
jgi:hypothetical protein